MPAVSGVAEEAPGASFGSTPEDAQHATISQLFTAKDHIAAGFAVAVVMVVVEVFMAVGLLVEPSSGPTSGNVECGRSTVKHFSHAS